MTSLKSNSIEPVQVGPLTAFFKSEPTGEEHRLRDQILDQLHQSLESDRRPNKPVTMTVFTREGDRIDLHFPSLSERKRRHPAAEERRRLLNIQLDNFLTTVGI
jgi:hypothetical protein